MNEPEPSGTDNSHILETSIRLALTDQKKRELLLKSTGWDSSMPTKVCSGAAGITVDKLDAVCRALGLTIVEVEYMEYLARGNEIGSRCCKARLSMGSCGAR